MQVPEEPASAMLAARRADTPFAESAVSSRVIAHLTGPAEAIESAGSATMITSRDTAAPSAPADAAEAAVTSRKSRRRILLRELIAACLLRCLKLYANAF